MSGSFESSGFDMLQARPERAPQRAASGASREGSACESAAWAGVAMRAHLGPGTPTLGDVTRGAEAVARMATARAARWPAGADVAQGLGACLREIDAATRLAILQYHQDWAPLDVPRPGLAQDAMLGAMLVAACQAIRKAALNVAAGCEPVMHRAWRMAVAVSTPLLDLHGEPSAKRQARRTSGRPAEGALH